MQSLPTVVIGEGWSALAAVGFLVHAGKPVCWIQGTGTRMTAPLPSLEDQAEHALGVQGWAELAEHYGIATGAPMQGCFLREFRNKAFREPVWAKTPTPEQRREVRAESLWGPEATLVPLFETRFTPSLGEIELALRKQLLEGKFPQLRRIDKIPVSSITLTDERVSAVVLGNGETIACAEVIFADRWNSLHGIQGLPATLTRPLYASRKRETASVLQAAFTHSAPIARGVHEAFYATLTREASEDSDRHVFGYFTADGLKSIWTICVAADEGEDNHGIAKKLRRMKTALEKMIAGSGWLPSGQTEFMATVMEEQVRFEEAAIYTQDCAAETLEEAAKASGKIAGLRFATDGYGPTLAMQQVATILGIQPAMRQPETDGTSEASDTSGTSEGGAGEEPRTAAPDLPA